jgi:iron complex outermembrane receptor protein
MVGVTYKAAPDINLYVSYGRGFQTPTLDELAYRATGGTVTGLNLGLKPSTSDDVEIGVKAKLSERVRVDLTAYHIDTSDELAVVSNTGGRAVYQNVPGTRRDGLELGLDGRWKNGFGVTLAYTLIRATYTAPLYDLFRLAVHSG